MRRVVQGHGLGVRGLAAAAGPRRGLCAGWTLGVRVAAARALHSQGPVGARRSKAFALDDLPDRVDAPQERVVAPPEPEWPPLALNVLENMRKFPNCLLLTRVGGFYEVRAPAHPVVL